MYYISSLIRMDPLEVWAHRGRISRSDEGNNLKSLGRLENTSITGIEIDIAFDETERIMVFHPGINKPVLEFSEFLNWFSINSNKKCLLELKQNSETLLKEALAQIVKLRLEKRIYITAFQRQRKIFGSESDGQLLVLAKELHPQIKTHLIVMWPYSLNNIENKYNPDIISLGWLLNPAWLRFISKASFKTLAITVNLKKQIENMRLDGIKVLGGICNDPLSMFYFYNLGVNGIVTDEPVLAEKLTERLHCF